MILHQRVACARLRWRQWRPALALSALLLLPACGEDNNTTTVSNLASALVLPTMSMPLSQQLRVESSGATVPQNFGGISYSVSDFGNRDALAFALVGAQASKFRIDARGNISAASTLVADDFPATLVVSGSVNAEVLASTRLTISLMDPSGGGPSGPEEGMPISIMAGQQFVVSDRSPGAQVGQVQFSAVGNGVVPAFSLSGTGAEHFAIDTAGMLSIASAPMADQFVFLLVLKATAPLSPGESQATLRLASAPVTPPTVTNPPGVLTRPPAPASARVFTAGFAQTVSQQDSGFSEQSPVGSCVARFANSRPANDPCWALVPVATLYNGVDHAVNYELVNDDVGFVIAGSLLLLNRGLRIEAPKDGSAPATSLSVGVRATFAAGGQPSDVQLSLPYAPPGLMFEQQSYDLFPADGSEQVVGPFGFRLVNAGPHRSIKYELESVPDSFVVAINDGGMLVIDTSQSNLIANHPYLVTASASISDFPAVKPLRHTTSFTTLPPQLSFAQGSHMLLVAPADNRAGRRIGVLAATSSPAQADVAYSITGDSGDNFYAGAGGQIFLKRALNADSGATLRVKAGENSATTMFSVAVAAADFTAVPVDATMTRRNIRFTAVLPAGVTAASHQWDFGDGSPTGSGATTTHSYATTGEFEVSLELVDNAGQTHRVSHTVYPHQGDDPFKRMQWHLRQTTLSPYLGIFSTGQLLVEGELQNLEFTTPVFHPFTEDGMSTGMHTTSRDGEDIRAVDHLAACGVLDTCRGEDIVVLVADSGAQLSHPDLVGNARQGLSRNLIEGVADVFDPFSEPPFGPGVAPAYSTLRDFLARVNTDVTHGTAVAGIILAEDSNDTGVVGVAPKAELASYNLIEAGVSNITQMEVFSSAHDVSNHSWTTTSEGREFVAVVKSAVGSIIQATTLGRGGRGSVIVRSAGNDGAGKIEHLIYNDDFGNRHNSGFDGHSAMPEIISVAGALASGEPNIQSENGANVLVSAYWALPCRYKPGAESGLEVENPVGIVTTDLTGGLGLTWGSEPAFVSALETTTSSFLGSQNQRLLSSFAETSLGDPTVEELNQMNDYTYCFNGTSGAAPQVSGGVALMLQARPELTWRDVRAILVDTARQNDPSNAGWTANSSRRGDGKLRMVHHSFGFGIVDVSRAVAEARNWTLLPDEQTYETPEPASTLSVADCSGSCGTQADVSGTPSMDSYSISGQMRFVETVEVGVRINMRAAAGQHPERLRGRFGLVLEHLNSSGDTLSSSVLQRRHPYLETPGLGGGSINPDTGMFEFEWSYLSVRHFGENSAGSWRLVVTDYVDDGSQMDVEWALKFRGHTP